MMIALGTLFMISRERGAVATHFTVNVPIRLAWPRAHHGEKMYTRKTNLT